MPIHSPRKGAEPWDPKDPSDTDAFQFDWRDLLGAGDTIVAHNVAVLDPGLNMDSSAEQDGIITATLSAGLEGKRHRVQCSVTISDGRSLVRTGLCVIRDL